MEEDLEKVYFKKNPCRGDAVIVTYGILIGRTGIYTGVREENGTVLLKMDEQDRSTHTGGSAGITYETMVNGLSEDEAIKTRDKWWTEEDQFDILTDKRRKYMVLEDDE